MDVRTGAAFWPLESGLIAVYPALASSESCDVAIIGAGITGALAAYRLTEAGCNVVVVDKNDVGMGSTAATTALLQYETDTSLGELTALVGLPNAVRSWQLGLQAIGELEQLCEGRACGFVRRPSVYFASSGWDIRKLRAEHVLRTEQGFAVSWLDRETMAQSFGFATPGAIRSEGDAQVNAYQLTHALLAAAVGRGARIYDRTSVTGVGADDLGVTLATSRGDNTIRARRVVVAAGYEVATYLGRQDSALHSTWAFISEPLADLSWWPDRSLLWETRRPYSYLRTTPDGRVLMGGEDELWSTRHENTALLRKKTARLLKRFGRLFPHVELEVAYAWAGVFGSTPDGLPYIGTVPEHPHTFFALGYGGNGITFSTIAAGLIRDWWTNTPNADAAIFAFDR